MKHRVAWVCGLAAELYVAGVAGAGVAGAVPAEQPAANPPVVTPQPPVRDGLGLPPLNNAILTELSAQVVLLHDVPGIGIAVADRNGLHAFGVAGVRKSGAAARITTEDVFHIGSCGKVMTAVMLARLVDRGVLRWEATIPELLPGVKVDAAFEEVTLVDLLRHRSGLSAETDRNQLPFMRLKAARPQEARGDLAARVLGDSASLAPHGRGTFGYSNTGYALAGHIAEVATGKSFEELMRMEVFGPLEMTTAGFGAPGTPGQVDQPLGHVREAAPIEPGILADNPAPMAPAGTVHLSLRDWSRFVAVLLGGGPEGYLSEAGRAMLVRPPEGSVPGNPANPAYALGLGVTEAVGQMAYSHAGSNTLWFAQMLVIPREGFGGGWAILVVTNHGGERGQKATSEVLQELLALSRQQSGK